MMFLFILFLLLSLHVGAEVNPTMERDSDVLPSFENTLIKTHHDGHKFSTNYTQKGPVTHSEDQNDEDDWNDATPGGGSGDVKGTGTPFFDQGGEGDWESSGDEPSITNFAIPHPEL